MIAAGNLALATLIFGAIALVGCSPRSERTSAANPPAGSPSPPAERAGNGAGSGSSSAKQAFDSAQDPIVDSWEDIRSSNFAQRESVEKTLNNLAARVDERMKQLNVEFPNASSSSIEHLRQARDDFIKQVRDLRSATESTWNVSKTRLAQSWDDLQKALAEFRKANSSG